MLSAVSGVSSKHFVMHTHYFHTNIPTNIVKIGLRTQPIFATAIWLNIESVQLLILNVTKIYIFQFYSKINTQLKIESDQRRSYMDVILWPPQAWTPVPSAAKDPEKGRTIIS